MEYIYTRIDFERGQLYLQIERVPPHFSTAAIIPILKEGAS